MSDSPFSLAGRTVLVTGASSGIGRATAVAVADAGGKVVATGRDEARLAETLDGLPGDGHRSVAANLLDADALRELVAACPPLDGVVHSAGISRVAPIRYTIDKILDHSLAVNLRAPVQLTRELLAANQMQDGGCILFISSISAANGWPGYVAYGAAKAGLVGVTKALAAELARQRVRCNCVMPGMVRTPMLEGGFSEEQLAADEANYPLGYGRPEDVAAALVFLLADSGRWITGQNLVLDGGATL